MFRKNLIKHRETRVTERGGYWDYSVYEENGIFVFEGWNCQKVNDGSSRGIREMYAEYENQQFAVQTYKTYTEV